MNEVSEQLARLRQKLCCLPAQSQGFGVRYASIIARDPASRDGGRGSNRRITSADFYAANDTTERQVA